jgi:hypothetical protein
VSVAARDFVSLGSYVRFYLTVLAQLDEAWKGIFDAHSQAKAALAPHEAPLAPLELPVVAATFGDGPPRPSSLDALWRPEDTAELSGVADVFEVVGRFSFQGVDNENLSRVQSLVSAARNEIHGMRARLSDLSLLPSQIETGIERLSAAELRGAERVRADKLAGFRPLAAMLEARARQTADAVRAVPLPSTEDHASAADEWRRYAAKVQQVYATCLPFLKKALATLFEYVGAEPPASWPDELPLVPEIPSELLSVPPADSDELSAARSAVGSLGAEQSALSSMQADVTTNVARLDGEIAALSTRDGELRAEVSLAMALVDYAELLAQVDETKRAIASYEQQKAVRTQTRGGVLRRNTEAQGALAAMEDELLARAKDIDALSAELEALRKREPVLFGKDEWRAKVAGQAEDLAAHRATQAQRVAVQNQIKIDLSSISVELQTEESQLSLLDRWKADAERRLAQLEEQVAARDAALGANRPAPRLSSEQALTKLQDVTHRRAELAERIERLLGERRRQKEEAARIHARLSQIETELSRVRGQVENAQLAATQGRDAAIRQLAAQRQAAVVRHVDDVLGGLAASLSSIGDVFLAPAESALLAEKEPAPKPSELARTAAAKVGPIVDGLLQELEPRLLAADAMLGQIQREFCDVAPDACANAWG